MKESIDKEHGCGEMGVESEPLPEIWRYFCVEKTKHGAGGWQRIQFRVAVETLRFVSHSKKMLIWVY